MWSIFLQPTVTLLRLPLEAYPSHTTVRKSLHQPYPHGNNVPDTFLYLARAYWARLRHLPLGVYPYRRFQSTHC
jgi:hypothetical protein